MTRTDDTIMKSDPPSPPIEPSRDDEARRWHSLIHLGEMSEADKNAFETWLNASAENRAAFESVDKLWLLFGQSDKIETWNAEVDESGDRHTQNQPFDWREVFTTRRIAIGGALAASLALVVSMVGFNRMVQTPAPEPLQYASAIAETKTIRLDDGSLITLSGATEAAVTYTDETRNIELVRGSAYFDVARDEKRPLVVQVADTAVRVVGTSFGVRLGPNNVSVAVTEGRVAISDISSENQIATIGALEAGERIVATLDGAVVESGAADIGSDLAWIEGRLVFDGAALIDVANDINRYRIKQVEVIGQAATMEITTSFKVDQIDQFLTGLPAAYGVDVIDRSDRTIIRLR